MIDSLRKNAFSRVFTYLCEPYSIKYFFVMLTFKIPLIETDEKVIL